jgi:hypothetical protein
VTGIQRDRRYLENTVSWYLQNRERLQVDGVESTLIEPTSDRSKNTAVLWFTTPVTLVSVAIWDSGECEAIFDRVDQLCPAEVKIVQMATPDQVSCFLGQISQLLLASE